MRRESISKFAAHTSRKKTGRCTPSALIISCDYVRSFIRSCADRKMASFSSKPIAHILPVQPPKGCPAAHDGSRMQPPGTQIRTIWRINSSGFCV